MEKLVQGFVVTIWLPLKANLIIIIGCRTGGSSVKNLGSQYYIKKNNNNLEFGYGS